MSNDDIDWDLQECCNASQFVIIVSLGASLIIIALLWRTVILAPFKLIAVFLHELGHALAAIITCGKVESIQVDENEGGATQTRGGLMCCILPAGYLGSSFWGAFFIIMAAAGQETNHITSRIAAATMILLSSYVLIFKAKNNYLRWLLLGVIVLFIAIWIIDEIIRFWHHELIAFLIFFGTMNSIYAICDIWDDLIARKEQTSDASKFAELTKTSARCWGWLWCAWSIAVFLLAVYFAVLLGGMSF